MDSLRTATQLLEVPLSVALAKGFRGVPCWPDGSPELSDTARKLSNYGRSRRVCERPGDVESVSSTATYQGRGSRRDERLGDAGAWVLLRRRPASM